MNYMKENPDALLDAIPTPREKELSMQNMRLKNFDLNTEVISNTSMIMAPSSNTRSKTSMQGSSKIPLKPQFLMK
jgi:hypothetical protein